MGAVTLDVFILILTDLNHCLTSSKVARNTRGCRATISIADTAGTRTVVGSRLVAMEAAEGMGRRILTAPRTHTVAATVRYANRTRSYTAVARS